MSEKLRLYYTLYFHMIKKEYFATLLVALGFLLSFELLFIYFSHLNQIKDGTFYNGYLRTGWGMKNNIGGMLALSLPGPIYLALKKKYSFLYLILNLFFLMMVALSESRGSLLVSLEIELILLTYLFIKNKGKRLSLGITFFVTVGLIVTGLFIFHLKHPSFLENIVQTLKNLSFDNLSSSRIEIWTLGWNYFKAYSFFGEGDYRLPDTFRLDYFASDFIPTRMHNTYVQILSSSRLFGMAAYLFHRYQSFFLIFKRYNEEKLFIFFFYFIYLACSFVDCHFFNLGPALLYSVIAVLAEKEDIFTINKEKEHYLSKLHSYLK